MALKKVQLLKAMREKDTATIDECLSSLFTLRAEQTAIDLAQIQELYGFLTTEATEAAIQAYYRDCVRLEHALTPHIV